MEHKVENRSESSSAVGIRIGFAENISPMGGTVSEAMKAVVTIDHCAAARGVEEPPAEKGDILFGPEDKYISAHWRKAYKLSWKN
eukprot:1643049-Pyramimonas_sp.AAC.1